MTKSTLVSFNLSDIASHGRSVGLSYNATHALMETEGIIPMYDASYFDIYQSDCTSPKHAYGWSLKMCNLFLSFMKKENVTEFRLQS